MAQASRIEWTESTWNPVTGCTKVSAGCANCYAEKMARRLLAMGNRRYENGFSVTLHDDLLELPLHWPSPRTIFVNSMSDLFHEQIPSGFIQRIFQTMARAKWHTFQVLTKRAERLSELACDLPWPRNVWMGVTVENEEAAYRMDCLRQVPAAIKFVSAEPLLGPLDRVTFEGIDWVIAGGESGPGARPMKPEWVRSVRDACQVSKAAFFFKQWGGVRKKTAGRVLDGVTWSQLPSPRRVTA